MRRPRVHAVMVQGTGSHAGKTVLAAGLCRLLARQGRRVAPFKAQNMALNAYVSADGGEMGWAQAMQAEAAGVPASVDMNPVLLKPYGDARSQIVVQGKVVGDAGARDYYARTSLLWAAVESSYRRVARDFDVVVIEGAGSPAEPNLMRSDIANMRVARMARAPVLIVGDIDRGGVFASLVGTMALLPPGDRRRVAGFLINKFRGDVSLLAPALADLRRRTERHVLGVVPFLSTLKLPEEDSVALDAPISTSAGAIHIAVVRVPHIANFTDFAPLEAEAGVRLRYAGDPNDLLPAHLVILPGSKDTIADLRFLRTRGFVSALHEHVARGRPILGICGGYQMLGRSVRDPLGIESGGEEPGLGLLPVETVLTRRKTTRRVSARWTPQEPAFEAYEIHTGRTTRDPGTPASLVANGAPEGCMSADQRIRGTYLHGLFEAADSRRHLWNWLRDLGHNMADPGESGDARALREIAYDRLAGALGRALDPRAFALLGL